MKYFEMNLDEAKLELKKLQADKKLVLNGKPRKVFLTPLVTLETIDIFSLKQYENFHICAKNERQRSISMFNNKESLAATGIFDKKIDKDKEEKIRLWTLNAYPNINEVLWDLEFEERELINYLRNYNS